MKSRSVGRYLRRLLLGPGSIWLATLFLLPAAPVPGVAQGFVVQGERSTLTLSGYVRVRANRYDGHEVLSPTSVESFYNARAYLTLDARRDELRAVLSLDVAGTDFNDGALLGNDNPALVRSFATELRYAWIEYGGVFNARVGRQPGRLGNSLVTHVTRDAMRVWKGFGGWVANVGLIKGAELAANSPTGEDDDLDALHLFLQRTLGRSVWKVEWARQFDTSPNERFPEKEYFDVNGRGYFGNLGYALEMAHLGGRTPNGGAGALDYKAHLIYAELSYRLGNVTPRLRVGRGSGDDDPGDGRQGNFASLFLDETHFAYTNVFADDLHGWDGTAGSLATGAGFANVSFLQPRVEVQLTSQLTLASSSTLLWATERRLEGTGPLGNLPSTGPQFSRRLGFELDVDAAFAFDPRSLVVASFGWFDPGLVYGPNANDALKLEVGVEFVF